MLTPKTEEGTITSTAVTHHGWTEVLVSDGIGSPIRLINAYTEAGWLAAYEQLLTEGYRQANMSNYPTAYTTHVRYYNKGSAQVDLFYFGPVPGWEHVVSDERRGVYHTRQDAFAAVAGNLKYEFEIHNSNVRPVPVRPTPIAE